MTTDEVRQLRHGGLAPDEILAVARHLERCSECSAAAGELSSAAADLQQTLEVELSSVEHPTVDDQLTRFVNGTVDDAERQFIQEHLAGCRICREDVADLDGERRPARSRSYASIGLVAAALAIVFVIALLRSPASRTDAPAVVRTTPPVASVEPARNYGEWEPLVRAALESQAIEMPPVLRELRMEQDVLRGGGTTPRPPGLSPAGAVVVSQQPLLQWTGISGARYSVTVVSGDEEIATSDVLREPSWTPPRPLARGRVYTWEVEARTRSGQVQVMPSPPQPPAIFRVLDARSLEEIERARELHAGDHFLLGLLYAHFGLREEAMGELRKHLQGRPDDLAANRIAQQVASW